MNRENPFLALRSYTRIDAGRFFGRDADLVILKSRLLSGRSVLLFAGSGTGKTSFLNARLQPAVERDWCLIPHSDWAARAPLDALTTQTRLKLAAAGFKTGLESEGLSTLLENAASQAAQGPRRFLLILDQFEEVFQHWRDLPAIDRFAEEIARITDSTKVDARVLFSMREEFLGELSLFDTLIPDLFGNSYRLKNPSREQTEEIVERTARGTDEQGLSFLLDDLVRLHLSETPAIGDHGVSTLRDRISLPFLQVVCHRIWEQDMKEAPESTLFLAGYRKGRADEELAAYCNQKLDQLLEGNERDLASEAFGYLMTRRGAKMAYELDNLAVHMNRPKIDLKRVLEKLSDPDVRILRQFRGGSMESQWFELYHDMYASFLFDWKASHDAERKRNEEDRIKAELQQEAQEQLRKDRRTQKLSGVVVLLLVLVFIGRGVYRDYRNVADWVYHVTGSSYGSAVASSDALALYPFLGKRVQELWVGYWRQQAEESALAEDRGAAIIYGLQAATIQETKLGRSVDETLRRQLAAWTGGERSRLVRVTRLPSQASALEVTGDGKTVIAFAGGRIYKWNRSTAGAPGVPIAVSESAPLQFRTTANTPRPNRPGNADTPEAADQTTERMSVLAVSPTGSHLLARSGREFGVFSTNGGAPLWQMDSPATARLATFSPNGMWVALHQAGQLMLCATETNSGADSSQCQSVPAIIGVARPTFSTDSTELALVDVNLRTVTLRSIPALQKTGQISRGSRVSEVLYLPGDRIALQQNQTVTLFERRQTVWTEQASFDVSSTVSYVPARNAFGVPGLTGAGLMDLSGKMIGDVVWERESELTRFTPDGNVLAVSNRTEVTEWSLDSPHLPPGGVRIDNELVLEDIYPDLQTFVTSDSSGVYQRRFDNPASTEKVADVRSPPDAVKYSPDGQSLFIAHFGSNKVSLRIIRLNPPRDAGVVFKGEDELDQVSWVGPYFIRLNSQRLVNVSTGKMYECEDCDNLLYSDSLGLLIEINYDSITLVKPKGDAWTAAGTLKDSARTSEAETVGEKLIAIRANQVRIWDLAKPIDPPKIIRADGELRFAKAAFGDNYLTISESGEMNVWPSSDLTQPSYKTRLDRVPDIVVPVPGSDAVAMLTESWLHVLVRGSDGGFRFFSRPLEGSGSTLLAGKEGIRVGMSGAFALWTIDLSDLAPLIPPSEKTWMDLFAEWSARLDLKINSDGNLSAVSRDMVVTRQDSEP